MTTAFNRPDRRSCWLNVGAAVVTVLVMNGLIFGLGWGKALDAMPRVPFAPPGPVVGAVWVVLFALLGTARWRLNGVTAVGAARARTWVTVLIVFCLAYPLYSLAIDSVVGGLIGNVATVTLAAHTVRHVRSVSRESARLILPVIVWVLFATAITVAELSLPMPHTL